MAGTAEQQAQVVLRVRAVGAGLAAFVAGSVFIALGATTLWAAAHSMPLVLAVLMVMVAIAGLLGLGVAVRVAVAVARVRPPDSPTVDVAEQDAPELYAMVRGLAGELDVPAPHRIQLSPDCDSWLEQRGVRADDTALVIGAPFLWWLRVTELRALLAPVVASTAAAADPQIASARWYVRRLAALSGGTGDLPRAGSGVTRLVFASLLRPGRLDAAAARLLLRCCQGPAIRMEREVAAAAARHARPVETGPRVVAHEQVGMISVAWDRLLRRLAAPAWQAGRRPVALNEALVRALSELERRDGRFAELCPRLKEHSAAGLLLDPAAVDSGVSALAADVFADVPGEPAGSRPLGWDDYVAEMIEPERRQTAATLVAALDRLTASPGGLNALGVSAAGRVLTWLERQSSERLGHLLLAADSTVPAGAVPAGPPYGDASAQAEQTGVLHGRAREAVADHLVALVECEAVDTGQARWTLDWLDGVVLRDSSGRILDLATPVMAALDTGRLSELPAWLFQKPSDSVLSHRRARRVGAHPESAGRAFGIGLVG